MNNDRAAPDGRIKGISDTEDDMNGTRENAQKKGTTLVLGGTGKTGRRVLEWLRARSCRRPRSTVCCPAFAASGLGSLERIDVVYARS